MDYTVHWHYLTVIIVKVWHVTHGPCCTTYG